MWMRSRACNSRLTVTTPHYVFARQHRLGGDVVEHSGRHYIKDTALYLTSLTASNTLSASDVMTRQSHPPLAPGFSAAASRPRAVIPFTLFAVLRLGFVGRDSRTPAQHVSFETDDGVTVAATWHEPPARPAAVIYVHMLQKLQADWEGFAAQAAAEGIGGLNHRPARARRHARQQSGLRRSGGRTSGQRGCFSSARGDVTPGRIAIAGASIGATLLAQAASGHVSPPAWRSSRRRSTSRPAPRCSGQEVRRQPGPAGGQ